MTARETITLPGGQGGCTASPQMVEGTFKPIRPSAKRHGKRSMGARQWRKLVKAQRRAVA